MGRVCARPASIRTARLLNKATGAAFLLEHLTRSASICLVLIIIDKLQGIMCGAEGAAPAASCPCSPCPGRCSAGICALALVEPQGCFPPGTCAAPQLPLNLCSSGEWEGVEEGSWWHTGGFCGCRDLAPFWPFPKGCCGSRTLQSVFAARWWEVGAGMSPSHPALPPAP